MFVVLDMCYSLNKCGCNVYVGIQYSKFKNSNRIPDESTFASKNTQSTTVAIIEYPKQPLLSS